MEIFNRLKKSKFRSSFILGDKEKKIVQDKGIETIRRHAREILEKRIRVKPANDGKQTPFKGHPVFTAQHATATCCRSCIAKWHGFSEDRNLGNSELDYLSDLIIKWVENN